MKAFYKIILFFLLASFLFARFSIAEEEREFIVGASLPLSGELSYVGKEIVEGLQLYLAKNGVNNKHSIKFIYDDNKHQGSLAASSAHRLLAIEKVNLIISLWDMAEVIAPIAETFKTPHIAIRAIPDITKFYKHTITFESTAESYVRKEVEFIQALNSKTVYVITEEAKGWNVINSSLLGKLKNLNVNHSQEILSQDLLTNQTILFKVLSKKPDLILIHANNPLTEEIVKFLKRYAPKQKFSGYLENIPNRDLVYNVPFIAFFKPAPWFEKLFFEVYHKPTISRGAHAYDIAKLINEALNQVKSLSNSEEIMNAILHVPQSEGASGRIFSDMPRVIENEVVFRVFTKEGSRVLYISDVIEMNSHGKWLGER